MRLTFQKKKMSCNFKIQNLRSKHKLNTLNNNNKELKKLHYQTIPIDISFSNFSLAFSFK